MLVSVICKKKKVVVASMFVLLGWQAQAATELVLASAYPKENFHTRNLQQFADDVNKATGGQLSIKLFPAGSLIKPAEIFSGVQNGKADIGESFMSSLEKEAPVFALDSMPFLTSGYEDARKLWEVTHDLVEKRLAEKKLRLLYAVAWPPQNLYSKGEIKSDKDFKGLHMRAYNPATQRIAEMIGAKPVTVQAVDLNKAIAAGDIDLMLTSSVTGVETAAWGKMKHYYKVMAWIPKNVVYISEASFSKLEPAQKKKLMDAAYAAEQRGWKMSQDIDQEYENQLVANKMLVNTLDPGIRLNLDRTGENLVREWLKKAGSEELMVLLKYTSDRSMGKK